MSEKSWSVHIGSKRAGGWDLRLETLGSTVQEGQPPWCGGIFALHLVLAFTACTTLVGILGLPALDFFAGF